MRVSEPVPSVNRIDPAHRMNRHWLMNAEVFGGRTVAVKGNVATTEHGVGCLCQRAEWKGVGPKLDYTTVVEVHPHRTVKRDRVGCYAVGHYHTSRNG